MQWARAVKFASGCGFFLQMTASPSDLPEIATWRGKPRAVGGSDRRGR